MSNETGGNAYPQNTVYIAANGAVAQSGPQGGMTLRDYFAAKAMQGILANQKYFSELQDEAVHLDGLGHATSAYKLVSQLSIDMADSMLEARK